MDIYRGDFDKIHFTECVLGKPVLQGTTMHIPVRALYVLRGHPLLSQGDGPYAGYLVFSGVVRSTRTVTEYIGDATAPDGFKEPYIVDDENPSSLADVYSDYLLEGVQEEPHAWVDNWVVKAKAFELQI